MTRLQFLQTMFTIYSDMYTTAVTAKLQEEANEYKKVLNQITALAIAEMSTAVEHTVFTPKATETTQQTAVVVETPVIATEPTTVPDVPTEEIVDEPVIENVPAVDVTDVSPFAYSTEEEADTAMLVAINTAVEKGGDDVITEAFQNELLEEMYNSYPASSNFNNKSKQNRKATKRKLAALLEQVYAERVEEEQVVEDNEEPIVDAPVTAPAATTPQIDDILNEEIEDVVPNDKQSTITVSKLPEKTLVLLPCLSPITEAERTSLLALPLEEIKQAIQTNMADFKTAVDNKFTADNLQSFITRWEDLLVEYGKKPGSKVSWLAGTTINKHGLSKSAEFILNITKTYNLYVSTVKVNKAA